MLISGHKTRSMFDRYDIVDEKDIQLAGQKLAAYLEGRAKFGTLVGTLTEVAELGGSVN